LRAHVGLVLLVLSLGAFPGLIQASRRRSQSKGVDLVAIRALPWSDFKTLLSEAYQRLGYTIQDNHTRRTTHHVDLILRSGDAVSFVQCSRWRSLQVDVKEIRELHDRVLTGNAHRGIFVTSGTYKCAATLFARNKPLELVDGPALAELLSEVGQPSGRTGRGSRTAASSAPSAAPPIRVRASDALPNAKGSMASGTAIGNRLDGIPFGKGLHTSRFGGGAKI
jgi:restriction system protein